MYGKDARKDLRSNLKCFIGSTKAPKKKSYFKKNGIEEHII